MKTKIYKKSINKYNKNNKNTNKYNKKYKNYKKTIVRKNVNNLKGGSGWMSRASTFFGKKKVEPASASTPTQKTPTQKTPTQKAWFSLPLPNDDNDIKECEMLYNLYNTQQYNELFKILFKKFKIKKYTIPSPFNIVNSDIDEENNNLFRTQNNEKYFNPELYKADVSNLLYYKINNINLTTIQKLILSLRVKNLSTIFNLNEYIKYLPLLDIFFTIEGKETNYFEILSNNFNDRIITEQEKLILLDNLILLCIKILELISTNIVRNNKIEFIEFINKIFEALKFIYIEYEKEITFDIDYNKIIKFKVPEIFTNGNTKILPSQKYVDIFNYFTKQIKGLFFILKNPDRSNKIFENSFEHIEAYKRLYPTVFTTDKDSSIYDIYILPKININFKNIKSNFNGILNFDIIEKFIFCIINYKTFTPVEYIKYFKDFNNLILNLNSSIASPVASPIASPVVSPDNASHSKSRCIDKDIININDILKIEMNWNKYNMYINNPELQKYLVETSELSDTSGISLSIYNIIQNNLNLRFIPLLFSTTSIYVNTFSRVVKKMYSGVYENDDCRTNPEQKSLSKRFTNSLQRIPGVKQLTTKAYSGFRSLLTKTKRQNNLNPNTNVSFENESNTEIINNTGSDVNLNMSLQIEKLIRIYMNIIQINYQNSYESNNLQSICIQLFDNLYVNKTSVDINKIITDLFILADTNKILYDKLKTYIRQELILYIISQNIYLIIKNNISQKILAYTSPKQIITDNSRDKMHSDREFIFNNFDILEIYDIDLKNMADKSNKLGYYENMFKNNRIKYNNSVTVKEEYKKLSDLIDKLDKKKIEDLVKKEFYFISNKTDIIKFYNLYFNKLNSYVIDFQKYLDSNFKTFYKDKNNYKPSFNVDKNNSQDIIDLYTYNLNISSCIMEQFLQIRVQKNKMICCDETINFIDLEHTSLKNDNYVLEESNNGNGNGNGNSVSNYELVSNNNVNHGPPSSTIAPSSKSNRTPTVVSRFNNTNEIQPAPPLH